MLLISLEIGNMLLVYCHVISLLSKIKLEKMNEI